MRKTILALILFFLIPNICHAEIYKDFTPYKTLKAIKESYPNAKVEEVKAAWVTEEVGFYKLTGAGLSGGTYLCFFDMTKFYKNMYLDSVDAINGDDISEIEKENRQKTSDYWKSSDEMTLDEKLQISWVRWVPDTYIPLERLVSRYGATEKCKYNEDDFQPFCSWETKGILANLTDDKKLVSSIEYYPTKAEQNTALGIKNYVTELPKSELLIKKKKRKM